MILRTARIFGTILALALVMTLSAAPLEAQAKVSAGLQQQVEALAPTDTAEVVVTFNSQTVTTEQVAAVKALGITRGLHFRSLPIMGVLATRDQVNALAAMPGVRSLWANEQLQWHNHESTGLTGAQRARSDAVLTNRNRGLPYSGKGVGVVVHDTGIDATHQDLPFLSKVVQNVQGLANPHAYSDLLPIVYVENQPLTDTAGHGTHVAGTVGGTGAASGGKYAGVAPGADLVGYGSGAVIFILDAVGGLDYALTHQMEHRIRAINNSWGSSSASFDPDDPVNVGTKRLYDRGIVVMFSAGNSGPGDDTVNRYCRAPWTVCVGNTYKDGRLNESSSRGFRNESQTVVVDGESWLVENRPTISGPGTFIISTRGSTNSNTLVAGQAGPAEDADRIEPAFLPFYTVLTGTSMSSPHLAGIVALMLEANPALSPREVKQILQQTATNLPGYETWEAGTGLVNAYAAVDRAFRAANYGRTLNSARTFHSNAIIQATKLDFTIDYNPIADLSPTRNRHSFTVPADLTQLEVKVEAVGLAGLTGNTINLVLIAPDGTESSSGIFVLFPLLTDRTVVVLSPQPGDWIAELRGLRGDPANPTSGAALPETVAGVIKFHKSLGYTGLDDIAGHPDADSIQMAVSDRLVDGDSDRRFRPNEKLVRVELADFLVMGAGIRQFLPVDGSQTFADLTAAQVPFAEAAGARGAAVRDMFHRFRGAILPKDPGQFAAKDSVRRVDEAYALVQSLGLEAQALALTGTSVTVQQGDQRIPIDDASQIPPGLEGYVQLALDLNIMNAFFSLEQRPGDLLPTIHAAFKPLAAVKRGAYAVDITRFFATFFGE
ncbi:MAG: S8 family serine peptidase [Terriglobales bacterium]